MLRTLAYPASPSSQERRAELSSDRRHNQFEGQQEFAGPIWGTVELAEASGSMDDDGDSLSAASE
jgi:hypothetical protein